jgi:hypothetical protein
MEFEWDDGKARTNEQKHGVSFREGQPPANGKTTTTTKRGVEAMDDELRPDYQLDYAQAQPNRFAARMAKGGRLVILEPDVADVFSESSTVNAVLKALLKTMPSRTASKPVGGGS